MTVANNSAAMRESNQRRIVNLIRQKPMSRADIARETGLSRAAVTILTDSLINDGIVINGEAVKSESGRRPTLLRLNPCAFLSVGVDLCREGCEVLICDFSGNKILEAHVPYMETADQTVVRVCNDILEARRALSFSAPVLGVCVCAPGPIDSVGGEILTPSGLSLFHNYNVKRAFSERLDLPVYLEKDTNVLALAEKNREGVSGDLMLLLADHGIGCAFVKDGHLFCGRDGMGGELGHTTVDVNGPLCPCGNVGCAELYASIPATVKGSGADDWDHLINDAKSGEEKALFALREQGRIRSSLCITAANVFEPDTIVLGGRLSDAEFILKEIIQNALDRAAFSRNMHRFRVQFSRLGEHARAYAAAITAIEYYFNGGTHL